MKYILLLTLLWACKPDPYLEIKIEQEQRKEFLKPYVAKCDSAFSTMATAEDSIKLLSDTVFYSICPKVWEEADAFGTR